MKKAWIAAKELDELESKLSDLTHEYYLLKSYQRSKELNDLHERLEHQKSDIDWKVSDVLKSMAKHAEENGI